MEFSPRIAAQERLLAALVIAAAAAVGVLEARSPLAAAARAGRPVFYRLSLEPGPRTYVAEYLPAQRRLWLVYAPDPRLGEDYPKLSFYAGRFEPGDPAIAGKRALKPLKLSTAWRLAAARGDVPAFDRLRLAVELSRMDADDVQPAWPPADGDLDAYWRALSAPPQEKEREVTVEILNGTSKKGVAARVTKILRSRDADVMASGNAPQPQARTVVYDRTGRPRAADWVRDRLGCAAAETATQLDAKSLVDVTVVLGDDCVQAADEP